MTTRADTPAVRWHVAANQRAAIGDRHDAWRWLSVMAALMLVQSQGLQREAAEQQHAGGGEGQGQHRDLMGWVKQHSP